MARPRAGMVGRAVMAVLGLQLGIGAMLLAADLQGGLPRLDFSTPPPDLRQPASPGDQLRHYDPAARPTLPGGAPLPETGPMPNRLQITFSGSGPDKTGRLFGAIAPGDGERVRAALDAQGPAPSRIALDSGGGSVSDALEIGRLLRARGIGTEVAGGAVCLSACPYILAGGTTRSIAKTAAVGVHQHYFGESTVLPAFMAVEDIQVGLGRVMSYLEEMGIDPLIMKHALVTPKDRIYILLAEELRRYRLSEGPD